MAFIEAGKAFAEALASNSTLKMLDVSSNTWEESDGSDMMPRGDGPGFAKELAVGVGTNGALETITFGDKQGVTMKAIMTEADLSGKQLGASGAVIVAAFLPKCL